MTARGLRVIIDTMMLTENIRVFAPMLVAAISVVFAAGLAWAGADGDRTLITAEELKAMIRSGETVTLIDVRTPEEYEGGHIPGAILMPLSEIVKEDDLPYEGTIVIYCRSGKRSARARSVLAGRGVEGLLDLSGGIKAWMAAGGNVIAGPTGDTRTYPPSFIAPEESCETTGVGGAGAAGAKEEGGAE